MPTDLIYAVPSAQSSQGGGRTGDYARKNNRARFGVVLAPGDADAQRFAGQRDFNFARFCRPGLLNRKPQRLSRGKYGAANLVATGNRRVPDGQQAIARAPPGLRVDVLKIPHHGSRYQDEDWLLSLRPRLAVASVGADNDYGHPAASTLMPLAAAGVRVLRTDRDGAVAVTVGARGLGYAAR